MSDHLPPRLHLPQVLELAGYGRTTLRARQRAGKMPWPIDRGPRGGIYDRDAVLKALGIAQDANSEERDPWDFEPGAINEHLARAVRRAQTAGGRQRPIVLSSPGAAPPLRLASDRSSATGRGVSGHG